MVIYSIFNFPLKFNAVLILLQKEPVMLLKSLLGFSLIGTIMFFIRSCETNFYTVLECDCIMDSLENGEDRENTKNKTLIIN